MFIQRTKEYKVIPQVLGVFEDLNLVVPWRCGKTSTGSFPALLAPVHHLRGLQVG